MQRITAQVSVRLLSVWLMLEVGAAAASADEPEAKLGDRWALLVGINEYDNLAKLEYCVADMQSLRERLVRAGFAEDHVVLMTDGAESRLLPTGSKIERQLDIMASSMVEEGDFLLVAFSGHGIEQNKSTYLCPNDADLEKPGTLIPFSRVYEQLDRCAARFRLAIIDACRNDPQAVGGERAARATGGMERFRTALDDHPDGVLVLTSCRPGQIAWEETEKGQPFQGGVFTHFLLEGLAGPADDAGNRDGTVTLDEWVKFATLRTKTYVRDRFNTAQNPGWAGEHSIEALDLPVGQLLARNEARPVVPAPPTPEPMPPTPEPMPRPTPPMPAPATDQLGGLDDPGRSDPLPDGVEPMLTNSIGIKLKLIPAGEFTMGTAESNARLHEAFGIEQEDRQQSWAQADDERPRHRVRISQPFYLGMYEVTKGQFAKFVEATGYKTDSERDGEGGWGWNGKDKKFEGRKPEFTWRSWGVNQSDRSPVVNVSHNDAVKFCQWLSEQEGAEYRLPTEAEWEYACRAGTSTRFYNGDDPEGLAQIGNVADAMAKAKFNWKNTIRARDGWEFTAPVGQYEANAFGLYDMTGNVWEWCSDWYDAEYYGRSPAVDPAGADAGAYRVLRGGGWSYGPMFCRCAIRDSVVPSYRDFSIGFRVARSR